MADSRRQGGPRPHVEARGSALPQRPLRHPQLSCQPVSAISESHLEATHGASLEVLQDVSIDMLHPKARSPLDHAPLTQ